MSAAPSPALGGLHSSRPTRPASPIAEPSIRALPAHFDIIGPLHALLAKINPLTFDDPATADQSALELTQLATAASDLKIRLTHAREVTSSLPDMDRTVEEQQEEIVSLELRMAEVRKQVDVFRAAAAAVLAVKEKKGEEEEVS